MGRTGQESSGAIASGKASAGVRVAAGVVFVVIAGGFVLLWAASRGWIDLGAWLGVCGFRQQYGLPCPGCYWTTVGKLLVEGHFVEAFRLQPAAAVFYAAGAVVAVFALLVAVGAVHSRFLQGPGRGRALRWAIAIAVVVFVAGWLAAFARDWSARG